MKNAKRFTGLMVIGVLIICAVSVSVSAQDWPQWRGTNRDSKVTGFKVPQTWPQKLNQSWKVDVGFADATPALANNRLYVFTRQGEKEVLRCLNSATGEQIWQTEGYVAATVTGPARSHPGPRSTPAVADGKVVTVGVGGVVSCHNAASGKLIWRNEDFTDAYPRYFMGMSPLIVDGLCVAHLGGAGSGQFVAFELATGNTKWKTAGDGPGYGSPVVITVDGTKQCVFQAERKLVGLDLSDGALLWEVSTPMEGRTFYAASPVADQQKVYYTGANNGVNAIEITKQGNSFVANKLWTNSEFSTAYNTPVLKDGFLYGLSNQNRLFCVNAGNGETAWKDTISHDQFGSIIDAGSVMVAISSKSNLVVFRPSGQSYAQLAMIKVADTPVYAHPILSGNRIYVKDEDSVIMYTLN